MKMFMLATLLSGLIGCATQSVVPARLYNLTDGKNITVQLSNFHNGFGRATAQLENGEKLEGEYTLKARQFNYPIQFQSMSDTKGVNIDPANKSSIPSKDELSWAEVYGFSGEADAKPVGTGTLVGSRGTIINIVFYTADIYRNVGDGVARSNSGNWYRIHVGLLDLK